MAARGLKGVLSGLGCRGLGVFRARFVAWGLQICRRGFGVCRARFVALVLLFWIGILGRNGLTSGSQNFGSLRVVALAAKVDDADVTGVDAAEDEKVVERQCRAAAAAADGRVVRL